MSYAAKIEELIAERDKYAAKCHELLRWKSTHAPRIEALEGLLKHAQLEAHAGREAIATLASEREANAILTAEVESLRRDAERLDWIERQHLEELRMHLVVDAEHDGEYYVCGDSNKPGYGPTLRAAIDAAMAHRPAVATKEA